MHDKETNDRLRLLESEIERRLSERFAALRDEFDRLRVESDQRWVGFLGRFEQDFRGLVPPELVAPPQPAAGEGLPDRPAGAGLLSIEIARSMDDAGNQVEALHRFLDLCRRHASRAALLISKGGSFAVWKASGFGEHGGNDEAVRRVSLPLDGGPLSKVIDGSAFRLPGGNDVSAKLGASDATAAVLVPMVVKEKVSGAVYADCTAEDASRFDPESIAFLTFLAGLFVDRLAARKLKPAPALRPLQDYEAPAAGAVPEPELEAAPGPEPEPDRESVRELETRREPEPETPRKPARETPALGLQLETEARPKPPRDSYGTQILSAEESAAIRRGAAGHPGTSESDRAAALQPPAPLAPEAHREPEGALTYEPDADTEEHPVQPRHAEPALPPEPPPVEPVAPPAPARPRPSVSTRRLAGPLAPLDGDERREEARRFAKLLVSEIKLYNEKAVQEGRTRNDLYSRLKEDIDRSRQMYDERIPADVRSSSNFFYEELVRILADGRAEALGI
jgi:hypothetical protein